MGIFSEERRIIKGLGKQKKELKTRKGELTEKLYDVMKAYKEQERNAEKLEKLSENCSRDAKEYLRKGNKERAKYYLARKKSYEQTIQKIRRQERVVDMMKDQVRDIDMAVREIDIKIPMIKAGQALESVADMRIGVNIEDSVKEADEAIENLQTIPEVVEEMEREGLTDTVALGFDIRDSDIESELEKISKEVEAERLSEGIPDLEVQEGEEEGKEKVKGIEKEI